MLQTTRVVVVSIVGVLAACSSSGDEVDADGLAGGAGASAQGGAAGAGTGGSGVGGKGGAGTAGSAGAAKGGSAGASGGAAGTSGKGGTAGTSGTSGAAGTSGGTAGTSGTGGTAGASGKGGAAGASGKGGAAGASGAAGTSGKGGQGGGAAGNGGSGGNGGAAAGAGGAPPTKSCKRGIAYGHHSVADMTALSSGMSWWYNWSPGPDDAAIAGAYAKLGVEFVPMIWGEGDLKPARIAMIPAGAKVLLGFNEPNFKTQSNLSPAQAAALWPQVEQIANDRGMKLASPALNYCGPASDCWATDPFVWFDQFFAACPGCKVDYLAVHWYACTKGALSSYLDKMKKYGKPIWLTEFSCLDNPSMKSDPAKQAAYMSDALALVEADPMVARYAWFTGRWKDEPAIDLLGASGQLTALGDQYTKAAYTCAP